MSRVSAARLRPVWCMAGLLLAYFTFPVDSDSTTVGLAVRLVLTMVGLLVLAGTLIGEARHLRTGAQGRDTGVLTMLLVLLVVVASLTFYLVDLLAPAQFVGLGTRTDALYFTLSTMTTVGFGDVHAEGQLARALVCGLIVFNIAVVASLVRASTRTDTTAR